MKPKKGEIKVTPITEILVWRNVSLKLANVSRKLHVV